MNIPRRVPAVIASSHLRLACDAQVDPSYTGEPLATIQGTAVSSGDVALGDLRTVIFNYNFLVNDQSHTDGAPVAGNFPAEFSVDLDVPPPAEVLNDFTQGGSRPSESRFSTGHIAVVRDGVDVSTDPSGALVGIAEDHILVYVEVERRLIASRALRRPRRRARRCEHVISMG